MSIITRPTKPVGGASTSSWITGGRLTALELNQDIDLIYGDHNGGLLDANISAGAAIQGSKLANSPLGVTNAKINDLTIQKTKISTNTGEKITTAQMEELIEEKAFSTGIGAGAVLRIGSVFRLTSGGNYQASVALITTTGATAFYSTVSVIPTTAIPIATRDLIACYIADLVYVDPNVTGKVVFISRAKT